LYYSTDLSTFSFEQAGINTRQLLLSLGFNNFLGCRAARVSINYSSLILLALQANSLQLQKLNCYQNNRVIHFLKIWRRTLKRLYNFAVYSDRCNLLNWWAADRWSFLIGLTTYLCSSKFWILNGVFSFLSKFHIPLKILLL
jgi:hypothetical protein